MSKKKILWITSTFPLNEEDVEVPWMVAQIKQLQKYYDITVMSPRYKGKGNDMVHGIPVIRWAYAMPKNEDLTHGAGMPTKLKNPFKWPIFALYLMNGRRTVKKHIDYFDLIFINWPIPHSWFVPQTDLPIINKYYTAEYVVGEKMPIWLMNSAEKAVHNIFISKYAYKQFQEITKIKSISHSVLPELPLITPTPPKPHNGINVLFVGRNVERKGLKYLLEAAAECLEINFHIVGKGTKELKEQHWVPSNVHIWDVVSKEQLQELYAIADIFVLPAIVDRKGDTEGQGVVLIEAMMNYITVIATNVGGIPEIVKHEETGLLVPEKDGKALAEAIQRLAYNEELRFRLSNKAHEQLEFYSWDNVVAKYREIFDKVMGNDL